ncbi:MAG: hypothetical protein KME07_05685 [Pegethrix bostrychoides GSE-TBD4-15B]|jgi:hypothetical protein|uniref:Uncharacterized protein n=1 Tax=Pegethrix bostrychoides GSE-TBD4-15B TaxID=2839662 RepID=A0A951P894_9CYAN|nr:hypothetical protein [Pegethrix bostrychoides GSE-TBD4-15B]
MGVAWKYWTHVRLEMSGKLKRQEIATLKSFFQQQFQIEDTDDVVDSTIQMRLNALKASGQDSEQDSGQDFGQNSGQSDLAAACLRCFVSHCIVVVCADLSRKFQLQRHFTQAELLAYVLNDVNPLQKFQPAAVYLPLAVKVVQSFQPEQSSLAYWTKRLVLQQKDLYRALANCGVYIASDWAILNHTTALQVQRQLAERLHPAELAEIVAVLASFHAVYRQDRLRAGAGQRCAEPTLDQLARMVQQLTTLPDAHPQRVLRMLRFLANELRQPRRTAILLNESLSPPNPQPDEQDEFLVDYQIQVRRCLKQAIRLAFEARLAELQQQPQRVGAFMQAMTLFFLNRMSMSQIAPLVGLQKQFQVTRLLNLKTLRAEVRQHWLSLIRQELPQILQHYQASDQPIETEQLDQILAEAIDRIMAEDQADCYSAKRRSESLFNACLCRYLNEWQQDSA